MVWVYAYAITYIIYSRLVISNSLISNNRLSRSENLVPVFTHRSTNRQQNIVEKRKNCSSSFPQYFQYISNLGVKLKTHSVKGGCWINCFPQFHKSDMSKYGYLEVFHSPLNFEITRVDCISFRIKHPAKQICYSRALYNIVQAFFQYQN